MITGHCRLNSHLAKLRVRDDPDCDLCGNGAETPIHLLCECSGLALIRERIYAERTLQPSVILRHSLKQLLTFYRKCSETNYHISRAF